MGRGSERPAAHIQQKLTQVTPHGELLHDGLGAKTITLFYRLVNDSQVVLLPY